MKHSKIISHCKVEITQSSPFIPYELAQNYGYTYTRNILRFLKVREFVLRASSCSQVAYLREPSIHLILNS